MKRFTLGSSYIGEKEIAAVTDVLKRNYISPGPVVDWVEKHCAEKHGLKHGLAINSGQSAIHVALQAIINLHIKHYDEKPLVAVPATTYISTLAAAILNGCDIVLVDVDIPNGNMCPESLRKVLNRQISQNDPVDILLPVHLYGKACDPEVFKIAEQYGIWVVEDACESTFAPGIGKGHILTTSFYTNHLISGGGGGLIMTNDDELDLHCWKLINHGRDARYGNDDIHRIADKFRFDSWGHSMKWNDVNAAIVAAQLERKDELYEIRRRNATRLYVNLADWQIRDNMIQLPNDTDHMFMMYPIVLDESLDANNVIRYLNDHGVEVRRMMPITNQPVVQEYFNGSNLALEFPNADYLNRQGFYVGVHPELSRDDIDEMSSMISEAIRQELNRIEDN